MVTAVHLDFETYGTLDLRAVGAYRYAREPTTEVLIACFATDATVTTWLPWRAPPPEQLLHYAQQPDVLFKAHNAEFEYQLWHYALRRVHPQLPAIAPARWRCTAVRAAAAGLPRALDDALGALQHFVQKNPAGRRLIRLFCMPRKPTKHNLKRRILPTDDIPAFKQFMAYCAQDVRAERALDQVLPDLSAEEWANYAYAIEVNERGVPLDIPTIERTAQVIATLEQENHARVATLTNGLRPTQRDKVLAWLNGQRAETFDNIQLKTITSALAQELTPEVREVLELRLEASKASTKKVQAMRVVACADHRARGTLMFMGAHTGRFSGKLIQPHNFTRGLLTALEQQNVLRAFGSGDPALVRLLYAQPMHMLAQSMRGFICAPPGYRMLIADYSMIETRVLAWLAAETKLLSIYHRNLQVPKAQQVDVYKLMATVLYGVPYAAVTSEQRRIGKNLRLGAGYQLGVKGLLLNCEKEGIPMTQEFAEEAIRAYREDNPAIVRLWYDVEDAAVNTVQSKRPTQLGFLRFELWRDWLLLLLPSGRKLHYYAPRVDTVIKFKRPKLAVSYYFGKPRGLKTKGVTKEGRIYTYGGRLVENAVQAVAFDLMIYGMRQAEAAGYPAVFSVHDENIALRKHGEGSIQEFERAICQLPHWGQDIPLVAEGFESTRYRKG